MRTFSRLRRGLRKRRRGEDLGAAHRHPDNTPVEDGLAEDPQDGDVQGVPMFVPPGHFYSPIPDPAETQLHLDRMEDSDVPSKLAGIDLDRDVMVDLWVQLAEYMRDAPFEAQPSRGLRYGYVNSMYDRGDGLVLHAFLRHFKPRRIIEIGCGWSSACSLDTVERFLDGSTEFTFVEPYPELLRQFAADPKVPVRVLENRLQDVPATLVDELRANDILFIDSTHVMKTGSDVCWYLFELLPRIAPGVLVHIHDMFWPFEYPRHWALDQNRAWNEDYAIRAFLTSNPDWEIVMFNDYLARFGREVIESTAPDFFDNPGGALWLRKLA